MAFSKYSALVSAVLLTTLSVNALAPAVQDHSSPRYSYALVTKDGNNVMENWNYNSSDNSTDKLFKQSGPDRLYVKKDGKLYVITDPASIKQMKQAVEPMVQLGKKQSALGQQQSRLGGDQSKLGEKQSRLGEQMGKLGSEMGNLASGANSDGDIAAKQQALQEKMDALQKQMDALNKQMMEPSRKQEALGKKQEELGQQQEKASHIAEQKIDKIIGTAFTNGLAKPA